MLDADTVVLFTENRLFDGSTTLGTTVMVVDRMSEPLTKAVTVTTWDTVEVTVAV